MPGARCGVPGAGAAQRRVNGLAGVRMRAASQSAVKAHRARAARLSQGVATLGGWRAGGWRCEGRMARAGAPSRGGWAQRPGSRWEIRTCSVAEVRSSLLDGPRRPVAWRVGWPVARAFRFVGSAALTPRPFSRLLRRERGEDWVWRAGGCAGVEVVVGPAADPPLQSGHGWVWRWALERAAIYGETPVSSARRSEAGVSPSNQVSASRLEWNTAMAFSWSTPAV